MTAAKKGMRLFRRMLLLSLLVLWGGALVGGTYGYFRYQSKKQERALARAERFYAEYMARGNELAKLGRFEDAEAYLRKAMDLASTGEQRCRASLAMGDLMLTRARGTLDPYATMARQYYDAVIDQSEDSAQKMEAYRGSLDATTMLGDQAAVSNLCAIAFSMATEEQDQAEILLSQLDVLLQIGSWRDIRRLEKTIQPFLAKPAWRENFELRWAQALAQALNRPEWFVAYAAEQPGRAPEEVRKELAARAIADFSRLSESQDAAIQNESLFQIASILCGEGRFHEAQNYIQVFLDNEPTTNLDDTLLLLTRMARIDGEIKNAEELIQVFLKRYRLNTQATDEFKAVVDQLEKRGQYAEALKLIRQYVVLPLAYDSQPSFLSKAAELANRLGRYDEGAKFFKELMDTNPDPNVLAAALMEQAGACIRRNDLAEAAKWINYYLDRFPNDPRRADALFKLFEIKVRSNAYATDIILIGTAALQEGAVDPRAVATLVVMARTLEQVGLHALAQAQYSKIGLLNITGDLENRNISLARAVGEAMLGNARCLLRMGETLKSDHLLRQLCTSFDVEPVRSEAAYWWATMALDRGQRVEAIRRLAMARADEVRPEIAARIQFEKNLQEIAAGTPVATTMDSLLAKLGDLPPADFSDFIRRAFGVYFEKLAAERDVAGMQKLFDLAAGGPHAADLPLQAFFLRLANTVLDEQGPQALAKFLEDNADSVTRYVPELKGPRDYLLTSALEIEKSRVDVADFVKKGIED